MKKNGIAIFLLLFGYAGLQNVTAQTIERTVWATDGGEYEGAAQSISWTIGEPCSEAFTSGGEIITQGFHQPEINLSTSIASDDAENGMLSVYPNPVSQYINLNFEGLLPGGYVAELYSLTGALIQEHSIQVISDKQITRLDLKNDLPDAEYILRIYSNSHLFSKSVKITYLKSY